MKTYRNLTFIKRRETLGRRLSLTGLIILFIGLMASFVPNIYPPGETAPNEFAAFLQQYWTWISFVALPAGFIFASLGSYHVNRFARRRWPGSKFFDRPDEMLERNMKGFDDKYAYFVWSLPASYLVAGPCGVLIFTVRSDKGRVTVQGDRWREPFSFGRIFTVFAREGVGNPAQELADQKRKLQALLAAAPAGEGGAKLAEVPLDGAAVFLNPDIVLDVDNPNVPALRGAQVKDFLRKQAKDVKLQSSTVRELIDYLASVATFQEETS